MKPAALAEFIDPTSGAPLEPEAIVYDPRSGDVRSGALVCPATGARYEIVDAIPRFVPRESYAANFGLEWQHHSKTQLDSHTGVTYSRDRLFGVSHWPADLSGQRVLEAGSGAGRFTEVLLSTGAEVWSFDCSTAVVANQANNGGRDNLRLFQGDIYAIPLPKRWFDKVICLGVIQHTPDVRKTVLSLASMVRSGGELVIDVYVKRLVSLLHWKYLLRPITVRMNPATLYRFTSWYAPKLIPVAKALRKFGGRAGVRLVPILDQSDKHVSPEIQRDRTILDTYDALSARFDKPQTLATLGAWLSEAGMEDIRVEFSPGYGAHVRATAPATRPPRARATPARSARRPH